ncbi:MAG: SusC/RagA family TonB-linked outer membrane protein [Gemmatimonadota bacterium]|nr:SusC/RagA family TonB-linked outer membrane protein [Gemmatimonadota bacterium]
MRIKCTLLAITLLVLAPNIVFAQTRTLSGTVVDSLTREPIVGARISVRGMALGTQTGANGLFSLTDVPQDEVTLVIRRIGYKPTEVRARRDVPSINAALSRDLFRLGEVVVTGQVTGIERRNLPNAIATVNAEELGRVPAQSVEHALQGKITGANIQTNSGAPGGGVQMQLRGVTSINAASEPLYVVDGIVVSNIAIPSNQNAVTRAASGSNPALTQDAQVNRIADLNPNDIETVEVLKGASASAIYGSKASNGVVIITTRRGRMGSSQMNVTQRLGVSELSNTLGSRTFTSSADAVAAFGPSAANLYNPAVYDQEKLLAGRTPLAVESLFDLSGGDENTRYFVSGVWKDEPGIIENTGFEKRTLRANIDQDFGTRLNLSVQSNVLRTLAQRGLTNNDNTSVSFWMVFPFTPSFMDLQRRPDGTFPENPFVASNPLQTAALMTNNETVSRYIASGRVTFHALRTPSMTLRFVANGGADYFQQENSLLFPPDLQFESDDGEPGTALLSNSNNLNLNGGASAIMTYSPSGGMFSSTTSAGIGGSTRDLRIARVVSRNLVGGLGIVSAGTNIQVLEQRQRVEDVALFAQEELLLLGDKLLLTAGLSADRTSSNSDTDKYFVYPKFAGSYRFIQPIGAVDELKVRAAVGQSGNQPLFGQKFTPLTATQSINGLPGLVVQGTVASADLHSEKQREIEGGLDLALANARGTIEVTAFRKDVTELLLQRTLAPSSGFATEIFNGGELRTSGVEVGIGLVPMQWSDGDWLFRTSYFATKSKIVSLPVPTFRVGGFGTALGAFQIEEGASATQIVGNDSLPDGSTVVRKIGDANPDFKMSFLNNIRYRAFRLYGLLDWQKGGDVINLTKFLYDLGSNTADFADPITVGGLETTVGRNRLRLFPKQTRVYVEDASFVKLREVTLAFDVPRSFVERFAGGRLRAMQLSLSGRNLATWTDYTGLDPEVSNFGNQPIARNIDVAPFPPSRSYWFSATLGF